MRFKKLILSSLVIFSLSCEKKPVEPTPETPKASWGPLNVLNTNSGYHILYDTAHVLGGVYNNNDIGLNDFTLEGSILNLAYYSQEATQQSPRYTNYLVNMNVTTKMDLSVSSQSSTVQGLKNSGKFFPYSNMIISIGTTNGNFNYNNSVVFGQHISAGANSPNPIGIPDLGFRFPVCNSGTGFGYFSKLVGTESLPTKGASYTMFNGAIGSQANLKYYKACLHEVYYDGMINHYMAIGVTADSVKVYEITYSSFGTYSTYPVYTEHLKTAMPTQLSATNLVTRHYSVDGIVMSFLLKDQANGKYSSYVYNFATNQLSQGLNQEELLYSGTNSDIDLDEAGNVYYTGTANMGSNSAGVSIYKLVKSNTPVLVGSDNVLISGEVIGLRILNNKVYFVVKAKQTDKEIYQISLIEQD